MKHFLPAAGWLLGVSLVSLGLDIYNKFNRNDGYNRVPQYLRACDSIQLSLDSLYKTEFGWVEGNMTRSGGNSFPISKKLFYDSAYKKYFVIEFCSARISKERNFDYGGAFDSFMMEVRQGENITALVNKIEMADTSYGTKQKPIPIFWFKRNGNVDYKTFESLFYDDKDTGTLSDVRQLYPGTIGIYLSHVKSKEDFEKMFGKEKE